MQCAILAGGLGTRMRSATGDAIPKALLPVAGRPFVDRQLEWLARTGVTEVVFCIGHLGAQLREFTGDGSRWGLKVRHVDEGQALRGTAGALRLAADEGALEERFLLTYGDSYLPISFQEVWDAFLRSGKPALMAVFRNGGRWDRSNVQARADGTVLYEKGIPAGTPGFDFIDYGVSALERRVVLERVPAGLTADLAGILGALSRQGLMAGHEVHQRFYEVGSPEGLADLEAFLRGRES
ncbi:MAG TPA: NTP transferase domain-containing protein [Myxococcaceae bacterium]|nr:NTP transferase domain-containing protein [Myxococcaceae bacterium]